MSQIKITLPIVVYSVSELTYKRDESFDPWRFRETFLAAPADQWKRFPIQEEKRNRLVGKEGFQKWQRLLRKAMVLPPKDWLALRDEFDLLMVWHLMHPISFNVDWEKEIPVARVPLSGVLETLIATIQLDKLQGAQFKVCARADCNNPPFRVEARQKEYCSYDCAHLAAVRRSRARAAESKSKVGKKSVKGKRGR